MVGEGPWSESPANPTRARAETTAPDRPHADPGGFQRRIGEKGRRTHATRHAQADGRAIKARDSDPRSERASEPVAQTRRESAARERSECNKPLHGIERQMRETPSGASRIVWAERESNPHSQRRLIYSQRSSPPARSAQDSRMILPQVDRPGSADPSESSADSCAADFPSSPLAGMRSTVTRGVAVA